MAKYDFSGWATRNDYSAPTEELSVRMLLNSRMARL